MPILKHDEVLALYTAVLSAKLTPNRDTLLRGIDERFIQSIPHAPAPTAQILEDLNALNDVVELADGLVPLITWLKSAELLAGPRTEAVTFKRYREHVERVQPAPEPLPAVAQPAPAGPPSAPSSTTGSVSAAPPVTGKQDTRPSQTSAPSMSPAPSVSADGKAPDVSFSGHRARWRSLSTIQRIIFLIFALISLGLILVPSRLLLESSLQPDCRNLPRVEPPEDDTGNRNLCPENFSGTCSRTQGPVLSVSGKCAQGRMVGHWEALAGSNFTRWEGSYCNGRRCGAFVIQHDAYHSSKYFYDNDGQPTGTWIEFTRPSQHWCKAEGNMTNEGREGRWAKYVDGHVVSMGEYRHGRRIELWEYSCNGRRWTSHEPDAPKFGTQECPDPCPDPP